MGVLTGHNPSREREKEEREGRGGERFDLTIPPFATGFCFQAFASFTLTSPPTFSSWNSQFHSPPPVSHSLPSFLFLFSLYSSLNFWPNFRCGFSFQGSIWVLSRSLVINGFSLLFLFVSPPYKLNSVKLSHFGSEFRVGFAGLIQVSVI